ncbi:MAG: hypothetical protein H8E38_03135 [SAR324 cluster bacterium]|nr:hypothetical protein [SAR324 cluster bacterium]MBL7035115.1 hypothetical protein [SAR324 cluster bacterium]
MDNISYLLSAHASCIEGSCLSTHKKHVLITRDSIGYAADDISDSTEDTRTEIEQWADRIGTFLDQHEWRDHAISFLLPAEDVTFRKITFPFQERKKVEQALPFELEEELMVDLAQTAYRVEVHSLSDQNAEALVLLIDRERLTKLQQLCLERDLLIRNVDCAAHSLFRSLKYKDTTQSNTRHLFQIYLGGDEAFINTIRDGRLDEIKIFPNRIPAILQEHLVKAGNSLSVFLQNFALHPDSEDHPDTNSADEVTFVQLKEELRWLCAQLTLHLRIKNYDSDSQIEVHGIFGPLIMWDSVVFRRRSFPLPEAEAFSERSQENIDFTLSSENSARNEFAKQHMTAGRTPDTLEELLLEARQREEFEGTAAAESAEEVNPESAEKTQKEPQSTDIESIKSHASLLSLTARKHWGILGELRQEVELLLESHQLSLYHESTPWKHFLRRNRIAVAIAASLLILITGSIIWKTKTQLELLQQEITKNDRLIQTELRRALPQSSTESTKAMLIELEENIKQRKTYIEISRNFQKRDYRNLHFLNKISILLGEDAPFQVDSMDYAPERFSLSGTIDSYDRLQILKNKLTAFKEFKDKQIIESNRKSPEGIVYRISIDLK